MLRKDLEIARERLYELAPKAAATEEGLAEARFWTTTTIRCLLGFVDGVSYAMRMAVVDHAKEAGLSLTGKEVAELRAKRYDAARDKVLVNKPVRISTEQSFKLAFRHFPRLFGSDYELDTGTEDWRGFKRLVRVRNAFTHPSKLEDLALINAFPTLPPVLGWVMTVYLDLIRELGARVGRMYPEEAPSLTRFREKDAPWKEICSVPPRLSPSCSVGRSG